MGKVQKKPTPWLRINLSTNGLVTTVRYSDMTGADLVKLLKKALERIPYCENAMELALKQHKQNPK